ncbi:MAG TPA: amino acid--tRNA ligase-related protein, partial [Vicinamibacterales bacterium]|nr:amino acid--tRNA ligase-related protein [Vicinamibacterales bacterium]
MRLHVERLYRGGVAVHHERTIVLLRERRLVGTAEVAAPFDRQPLVLQRDMAKLEGVKAPFPRITYDDAVKLLTEKGLPFEWGGDLGGPDETALSEHFDRPVMVHRYPAAVKAFYMKPDPA